MVIWNCKPCMGAFAFSTESTTFASRVVGLLPSSIPNAGGRQLGRGESPLEPTCRKLHSLMQHKLSPDSRMGKSLRDPLFRTQLKGGYCNPVIGRRPLLLSDWGIILEPRAPKAAWKAPARRDSYNSNPPFRRRPPSSVTLDPDSRRGVSASQWRHVAILLLRNMPNSCWSQQDAHR